MFRMAVQQLALPVPELRASWKLDPRTIERGKKGVKEARAALREAAERAERRRVRDAEGHAA
jgi:hypothetical protein